MMREDVYRDASADYDFSCPRPTTRMRSIGFDEYENDGMMMDDGGEGEEMATAEEVSDFLDTLYTTCKWTPECNIMALILIVRLFQFNMVSDIWSTL